MPSHVPTADAFEKGLESGGAKLHYHRKVSKTGGTGEAQAVVQELIANDIDNVVVLTSPMFFMQMLKAASAQDYHPRWTGVGLSMTAHDSLADVSCDNGSSFDGALFFSPIPAFPDRDDYDKKFDKAFSEVYPNAEADTLAWLGWAGGKVLHRMLAEPGRSLSVSRFLGTNEKANAIKTGIIPPVDFSAKDHFAGKTIHVLRADCDTQTWKTVKAFVGNF